MIALLNWSLAHWWVFFWLAIFGVFEGVRDFFVSMAGAAAGVFDRRHQQRLEEIRAAHPVPAAEHAEITPAPGRCVHRRIKQVRDVTDELVGWLCVGCDTRLPPDWAVAAEDLPEGNPDA